MKTTYLSFHFQMNLKERVISEFKMDFMKSCLNSGLNSPYSRPGWGGGGTPIHYLSGYVPPAQRGHDFEAPDLERGIHFRGVS